MSKLVHTDNPSDQRSLWRAHFDAMAQSTHPALPVHEVVGERLLERLDGLNFSPKRILDVGCGDGRHAIELYRRFPEAQVIAMDWSRAMAQKASKNRGWWRRRFEVVVGDGTHPPIQPHSVDLVFANFVLAYTDEADALLKGLRGALKPSGLLLISGLGPDTLARERELLGIEHPRWFDVQQLGALLTASGFNEPVLDTDWVTMRYNKASILEHDLDQLGVWLDPKAKVNRKKLVDEVERAITSDPQTPWSSTWECLYASAFAPDEGQTIKSDQGTLASIPIDQIGIRRR